MKCRGQYDRNAEFWLIWSRLPAMIRTTGAVVLSLFLVAASAQNTVASRSNSHGTCRENDDPVGYPLQGWVGYTNTGKPVSHMTVQAFTDLD